MDETLVYGTHAVVEALDSGGRVNKIFLASDSKARGAGEILARAKEARVPVDRVPVAKLTAMAGTSEHQGVAARISPIAMVSLGDMLAACPKIALIMVLDQVQHSRNLGLIARTALGVGASGVVISARGGAPIDETVVRASAGAVFKIPIAMVSNVAQALREIKDTGFWVYGLDAAGDADAFTFNWAERSAIVVGNESTGLRGPTRKACDALVRVPASTQLESLNAAVASSVALYQAAARIQVGPFSRSDA